jgi:DNA ligase-1
MVRECPPNKIINPKTGRCINKSKEKTKKVCPKGKIINAKTGRCINKPEEKTKKICPKGKIINAKTGRCINKPEEKTKKICPKGKIINAKTGRCINKPEEKKSVKVSDYTKGPMYSLSGCSSGLDGDIVYDVKSKGVLLAKNYSDDIDTNGWWASEKWDGYRAIWNGKSFVSRQGKNFDVPEFYKAIMPPNIALDGELWLGRGKFEECGLLRQKVPNKPEEKQKWEDKWRDSDIKYEVFDILNIEKPFEERMKLLKDLVKARNSCIKELGIKCPPPLEFTTQTKVTRDEALEMAKDVISGGGEGIMLRQPGSLYEAKRSKTLYKIKEVDDMECKITGYKGGTGKYTNMLGSFICSLLDKPDITFNVSGMDDIIRGSYKKTHPIGTIITITYNGLTGLGKPRHPRYLRIRHQEGY